jgi:hypothetical protein
MKTPRRGKASLGSARSVLWDVLTLEKTMTGSIAHLVYWAGLGVIALVGFSVVGASIGVALREGDILGWLLAAPVFVTGLLIVGGLALIWRSFCEFYVVVLRIGDDLSALRKTAEAEADANRHRRV